MKQPLLEFAPEIFWRVLGLTLALVLVGFALCIWKYDTLALRDVIGATISAVIFAYMVHLWVLMARRSARSDGEP